MNDFSREPMLDMFIFETNQLVEQLEQAILSTEKSSCYTHSAINEIFRIMHTIKSSSAMMLYNNISNLAHKVEDLFYFLREEKPQNINCSELTDLVLESVDFIKTEIQKIEKGDNADGENLLLLDKLTEFLSLLKDENNSVRTENQETETKGEQKYYIRSLKSKINPNSNCFKATIYFEEGCGMENVRSYIVVNNLKELAHDVYYIPADIIDNDDSAEVIKREGFQLFFRTDRSHEEIDSFLNQTIFLKDLELAVCQDEKEFESILPQQPIDLAPKLQNEKKEEAGGVVASQQSIISVNVAKLDKLMDLVGELVISEAMVTQNPDLRGLTLHNFQKASRQLRKITSELQDTVMSIRMVPLSTTFQKMRRIVRDMCKKLDKEVHLEIIGEETEVDKNVIEHISDPLMHLIRNSIDHGIEKQEERTRTGKDKSGKITLEAKNAGGEVLIAIKDDGRGLDKEKILRKAREKGLLDKSESEMSDKEIYSLIFLPGFSTKENITEFSGRGVGMDVVSKNVNDIGGSLGVESSLGEGTIITIKIPLTLAIIDGMTVRVGNSRYTISNTSIRESFKVKVGNVIKDPDGNEMIMVRGQCYPILRLHQFYKVKTEVTEISQGIIVMVENEEQSACIFADELLGQQQVVVKALPRYIKKVKGLTGCTLLGDGSISLILDAAQLVNL